jgi:predicted RNA-binding protein YlqC (UPF0109 family)
MMTRLIEHVVKNMVDHADQVTVSVVQNDDKTVIQVMVAADDIKRVIGKEGRIIRCLRSLARALHGQGELDIVVDSPKI